MQQRQPYTPEIEERMLILYQSLSEKDQRHYAGIEAQKIGYGGISYVTRLFGINFRTVKRGIEELKSPERMIQKRIRAIGGGRKKKLETIEGLETAFLRVIDRHIAGSPMNEEIRWTHLTRQQIADLIWKEEKIKVSVTVIEQLLALHKFRRRRAQKTKATGSNPQRNEQFENINRLIEEFQSAGNPVMSIETKKKEKLGQLYRDGQTYNQKPIEVYDHDWVSLAEGVVIPHGLYDHASESGLCPHRDFP